jgi:CRP/FNR family transcriptional regulator, cyclic AMP receptor protein
MMIDIDLLLAMGAAYKKIPKGTIIFGENTTCCFYHQVVSGQVKWVNVNEEGKEFIQDLIGPGECFGEFPLFDKKAYVASAIAEEDSVIIRLHKSSFIQLFKENPDIHFKFSELLASRLRHKFIALQSISSQDPEIRIVALLNYLKQEHKNICPNCHQLKLTRSQIASMTGLRVETVIRSMRHMHTKGNLVIEKGKVYC